MSCSEYFISLDGETIGKCSGTKTLLESLEEKKVDILSLCRQGKCGCCKLLLKQGVVTSYSQMALTESEIDKKIILACCSYPRSDIDLEYY